MSIPMFTLSQIKPVAGNFNPFPHIDAFDTLWQLKVEIAQNKQFLFATMLPTLFSNYMYIYIYRAFLCDCLDTFRSIC